MKTKTTATALILGGAATVGLIATVHASPTKQPNPVEATLQAARVITGWGGCVQVVYEPDTAAHSFSQQTPTCYQIHLNPSDATGRYGEHIVGHEFCHIAVGINHSHDLVFRSCMTKVSRSIGMQEIYHSEDASYPYRINDLRTGQRWDWPVSVDSMTE